MPKFRKKPVVIEAVQYTGTNGDQVVSFVGESAKKASGEPGSSIIISTLEGDMVANAGDWIIKGVNGEFYPCKPDIFGKTYEPVND